MKNNNEVVSSVYNVSAQIIKPDTYYIQFNNVNDNNAFMGKLFLKDGKLDFEEDTTESAKMFIEELKRMWCD